MIGLLGRGIRRRKQPAIMAARRFGVDVEFYDRETVWDDPGPDKYRISKAQGPRSAGCDIERRRIIVPTVEANAKQDYEAEWHELFHVLCAIPGTDIEEVDEAFMLMQVERAYAREYGPTFVRRVVSWQEATSTAYNNGDELSDYHAYRRAPFWRAGYARGRRIGLLDTNDHPTWRWPNWKKLTRADWREIIKVGDATDDFNGIPRTSS